MEYYTLLLCAHRLAMKRPRCIWYCLPDSLSSCVYNPETSSRVTLASLGIGFQPKLVDRLSGCLVGIGIKYQWIKI